MKITVVKGAYEDRILVCFWIGEKMQSLILSPTELKDIMEPEDVNIIMSTPLGVWKAIGRLNLMGG